ncbi:hypothetical protein GCM10020254_21130 [Streptomyces goshikiensis]
MPTGFFPLARPTAREAFGLPSRAASSPYDQVWPYGMRTSCSHTLRWNSVPSSRTGTVNSVSSPAKYAVSCATTAGNGSSPAGTRSPKDSSAGRWRWPVM